MSSRVISICLIIAFISLAPSIFGRGSSLSTELEGIYAVIDFRNLDPDSPHSRYLGNLGTYIANQLISKITKLRNLGRNFSAVESAHLKVILEEVCFLPEMGIVSVEKAAECGRAAGADRVIVGDFQFIGGKITIAARIIDAESRIIMATFSRESVLGCRGQRAKRAADELVEEIGIRLGLPPPPPPPHWLRPLQETVKILAEIFTGGGSLGLEVGYDRPAFSALNSLIDLSNEHYLVRIPHIKDAYGLSGQLMATPICPVELGLGLEAFYAGTRYTGRDFRDKPVRVRIAVSTMGIFGLIGYEIRTRDSSLLINAGLGRYTASLAAYGLSVQPVIRERGAGLAGRLGITIAVELAEGVAVTVNLQARSLKIPMPLLYDGYENRDFALHFEGIKIGAGFSLLF